MRMNACARRGFLIDGRAPLPADPTELDVDYLPVIGCSNLVCEHCRRPVENEVTRASRRYFCDCSSYTESSSHPLWDPDPIPERDPLTAWRCAGHPPLALPCEVDGVALGSEGELARVAERVLAGWMPPRAREADQERVVWLRRLYARLVPEAQRVLTRVALDHARAPDADERGRALILFKNVRDEAALRELFALYEADRTAFAGIPDHVSSVSDETLEDSLWRAVARLAAREGRVREAARSAALLPGRGSRALYDLLAAHDREWLKAQEGAVQSATPEQAEELELSLLVDPEPSEPDETSEPPPRVARQLNLEIPLQRAVHEGRVLLVQEIASYFASGSVDFARATAADLNGMGVPTSEYLVFDEPLTDEDVERYRSGPWDSPHEFWRFHQPPRPVIELELRPKPAPPAARSWPLVEQVGDLPPHQARCLRRVCEAAVGRELPADPQELVARTLEANSALEDDLREVVLRLNVPEPMAASRELLEEPWDLESGHWTLENGVLCGRGKAQAQVEVSSFELGVEVKLSRADANLWFRVAQYTGYCTRLGDRAWGGLYDADPRRGHTAALPVPRLLARAEGYNYWFVRAEGPRLRVWLNGAKVADVTDREGSARGAISFEVQPNSGQVAQAWFKNVRLGEL